MKALNEFQGVNHVTIHIPDDDGEPLCDAPREEGNDLYGPHEVAVTPSHVDVCDDCGAIGRSRTETAQGGDQP